MTRYVIGIDIGTFSVRAVLIDELGELVKEENPNMFFARHSLCGQNRTPKIGGLVNGCRNR